MFPTPLCVRPFNSVPLRVTFFTLNENTSLMSKFKPLPQIPIFTIRSSIADVATTVNRKEFESLKQIVQQQTQLISEQGQKIEAQNTAINALSGNVTDLTGIVADLQQKANEAIQKYNELEQKVAEQTQQLKTLQQATNQCITKYNTISTSVEQMNGSITDLTTALTQLKTYLQSLTAIIDNILSLVYPTNTVFMSVDGTGFMIDEATGEAIMPGQWEALGQIAGTDTPIYGYLQKQAEEITDIPGIDNIPDFNPVDVPDAMNPVEELP